MATSITINNTKISKRRSNKLALETAEGRRESKVTLTSDLFNRMQDRAQVYADQQVRIYS